MPFYLILISLVGATLIVVRGGIFSWLRRVGPRMLECAQCTGFWVGAAAGVYLPLEHSRVTNAFVVGCATSLLSLLADAILIKLLGDPNEVSSNGVPGR